MLLSLDTTQILLLVVLMYLPSQGPFVSVADTKGRTVGDWIGEIDRTQISPDTDYGFCMRGRDHLAILAAVRDDPVLSGMEIVSVHIDHAPGGGGGVSAVFREPETGEAVIAFRGTAPGEWKDDLIGGGPTGTSDGVSTVQQMNALEWYQGLDKDGYALVTVTGHSKGGNKAKYITLLDDTVDRCLSFDGQGFSDEFIETYREKIAHRQKKIVNHNSAYDPVNILLNDVGERVYHRSLRTQKGGILGAHCPIALLRTTEDGSLSAQIVPQSWEMQEIDQFVNSFLRSLAPGEKIRLLALVGDIVQMGAAGDLDANGLIRLCLAGDCLDSVSYLLAYLIRYRQEDPLFAGAVNSLMHRSGMTGVLLAVRLTEDILGSPEFGMLRDIAVFMADRIPGFIIDWISEHARRSGILLEEEQIRRLFGILLRTATYMDHIRIEKDGEDKDIQNAAYMI